MAADEYPLMTPLLNVTDLEPGWWVSFRQRNGTVAFGGPFPSKETCQRVIDGAEPCITPGCPCVAFGDMDPEREVARNANGIAMCPECNKEFVAWHKKKFGRAPTPAGQQ